MSYSKKKRAEVKIREIVLQHNLDELDYKICNDADLNPHILDQYEAEKIELNSLYESKYKKAIFRSKVKWIEQGEKPAKYLFNLQEPNCKVIRLPNLQEAKISQFADDTTLISKDTNSLKFSLQIIGSFGSISGLRLNKKKTKAMWIGSSKHKKKKLELAQTRTTMPTSSARFVK